MLHGIIRKYKSALKETTKTEFHCKDSVTAVPFCVLYDSRD